MHVAVVMNPAAGGGRMRARWPAFAAAIEARAGRFDLLETTAPGDASRMAEALAAKGATIVFAAGGDGTVSEVADGLLRFAADAGDSPALAIAPVGTGCDFAKALAIPTHAPTCVGRVFDSDVRRIDAGRLSFVDDAGRLATRHFVSIASLGVSGDIDRVVNRSSAKTRGRLSGKALFFAYTLRELMRYRFQDVSIVVDDRPPIEKRIALVAVANNRSFGGGMMIAPDASLDDGQFDIVVVSASSRLGLMRDLPLVYTGAHTHLTSCSILRGRRVVVTPLGDGLLNAAALDIDGESPGRIPATFEMMPKALKLMC